MRFFGLGSMKSLAGAGYVVLNVIRVLNIIALMSVIAASSVMLVKTFIVSKFFFFDATEHIIRSVIATFLILTELPLFKGWISRCWPLFSPRHGFTMLGFAQLFLGNSVLGNLNKEATSQENLGLAFWRLVIASGIIVLVMGPINITASFIFGDRKTHLTARHVRSHGAVASHKHDVEAAVSSSTPNPNRRTRYRSFFLGQKRNSLPSYYSHNKTASDVSTSTPNKTRGEKTYNISSPISPASASSKYSQPTQQGSPVAERHQRQGGYGGMGIPSVPSMAKHPAERNGGMI